MSFNKKILAVAIVGGLFSTAANAQVNLSNTGAPAPVVVASENADNSSFSDIGTAAAAFNINTALRYNFDNGEARFGAMKCDANIRISLNGVPTLNFPTEGTIGAVNGNGTSTLFFTLTDNAGVTDDPATPLVNENLDATDVISFPVGAVVLAAIQAGSCSFGVYSNPTDAGTAGTAGVIPGSISSQQYVSVASGYTFGAVANDLISDGTAANTPAFTTFTTGGTNLGNVGSVTSGTAAGDQLYAPTGSDIGYADIFGTGSALDIRGDFTGVASVFLSDFSTCTPVLATTTTAVPANNVASITVNALQLTSDFVCLQYTNGSTIPVTNAFTATLRSVAASAAVRATTRGPLNLGSISRNGVELQATLTQQPTGWISRIAVANDNSTTRPYQVRVLLENGQTAPGGTRTGNLAPGLTVIDVSSLVSGFSGAPRATVILSVAANTNSFQALYQLVEPTKGAITNAQMVRPGTN